MITLDIIIPSKGRSTALILQKRLVQEILNVSDGFPNIKVKFIFNFNCAECDLGSFIKSKRVRVSFNNENLGFDINVFKSLSLSNADYMHLLSDNDYRTIDYWIIIFNLLSNINENCKKDEYPDVLVPVSKISLRYASSYPSWHRKGTEELYDNAKKNTTYQINNDSIELVSTVLSVSQISHFVIKRAPELQGFLMKALNNNLSSVILKSGVPHSIYLIEMIKILSQYSESIKIKPFFAPCLLASFPEKRRSNWFYDSTFIGQRNLYKSDEELVDFPDGIRNTFSQLSDYLTIFGLKMLAHECYFIKIDHIVRWVSSVDMPAINLQQYNPNNFSRLIHEIKLNLIYYFYRSPLFVLRFFRLFFDFILVSCKKKYNLN
jgi:hypothetical protein